MKRPYALALGAIGCTIVGAGLMFFLDPKSGTRRRALVRDKARHGVNATSEYVTRTSTNLANHARGLATFAAGPFRTTETPADDVLLARVKSRIGHVVSEPHAIEVKAEHGKVFLAGRLDYRDAKKLLKTVAATRGVSALENHLAVETQR